MPKYLQDNLDYLSIIHLDDLNNNIRYQTTILDAPTYNTTQNEIYHQLNHLYEKVRLLETVTNHLWATTTQKLEESHTLCETLLETLQPDRAAYKNKTYRTIEVPLSACMSSVDRDGSILPSVDIKSGSAMTHSQIKESAFFELVPKSIKTPYFNSISKDRTQKHYRAYYVADHPMHDGIVEEIECVFQEPFQANQITFTADKNTQCEIVFSDTKKCVLRASTATYKEQDFLRETIMQQSSSGANQYMAETALHAELLEKKYKTYLLLCDTWHTQQKAALDIADAIWVTKPVDMLGANQSNANQEQMNTTIDTQDIMTSRKSLDRERIIHMYQDVDNIYPSYERYRYDFLDASHERYYAQETEMT